MNNTVKKYKVVKNENIEYENVITGKMIAYFGILAIICILSFLVAKYIVRDAINGEDTPIDTSERL